MIFIGLLFLSALAVSGCAAWFSVAGLISIFSSAPLATGLMGGSLELAKLVAASWIYRNWTTAPRILRYYFTASVVVLSIITSLGIFGYLSKAHLDQAAITGQSTGQLAIIDEKIKTFKENIDGNRKALKQLDEAVDQVMGRSDTEKGAERAVSIRRSQQKERDRLQTEIQTYQTTISRLNEERAPLAQDVRKIEAEVGPIKYVAELIYGSSTEDMIGKAVRLIIMSLICVFDPLAILLVIAGNMSLLARERVMQQAVVVAETTAVPETTPAVFQYEEVQDTVDPEEVKIHKKDVHHIPPEILDKVFNKAEHPHARRNDEVPKN
jgi:uncharacterized membrane protein (DUF106 family)